MKPALKRPLAILALAVATALGVVPSAPARAAVTPLVGTFAIAPGSCASTVSGSYFRMILPTGDANGPFAGNGDSVCSDQTYSPLIPGTDAGLITGMQQPAPDPAFDSTGNGLASRITRPTPFYGVDFAVSTEAVDPQTGMTTPAPVIAVDADGVLSGTLPSFGASWNEQAFNQGAPKPDGSYPGNSSPVAGTFDAATGAFTLTWRSQIEGGPFDNFTGVWHLEGTFRPAGGAPTATTTVPTTEATPGAAAETGSAATGADGGVTATPAGPGGSEEVDAAPVAGDAAATETVSTEVSTSYEGWQPARWLVLLIATAGLAGAVGLVWLSRTEPDVSG